MFVTDVWVVTSEWEVCRRTSNKHCHSELSVGLRSMITGFGHSMFIFRKSPIFPNDRQVLGHFAISFCAIIARTILGS